MKLKKKRADDAVSEVIGAVLMLGIAISLFSVAYLFASSFPFTSPPPSVNLVGFVEGNNVIIEHHGGEALSPDTNVLIRIGNTLNRITVGDCLDDDKNGNGWWDIGERLVVYSAGDITGLWVKAMVVDVETQSMLLIGVLQEGEMAITPTVTTLDATDITSSSAKLWMNYNFKTYSGSVRFTYKEDGGSWDNTTWVDDLSGSDTYGEIISGLSTNILYYFKAQLKYDSTEIEGDEKSFISQLPLETFVDPIVPYTQTASPLSLTATGSSDLDNVTLYYRWSNDNSSWGSSSGVISDETKNAIDSNTCDVDSSPDIGSETDFVNAQDTAPDSDVMNIQESDTGAPGAGADINEWLDADDHTEALTEWGTHVNNGDAEYVTAADDDIATHSGSYIHEASKGGKEERLISFEPTVETGSGFTVNISIRMATQDGAANDGFNLYYDKTGAGSSWSSAIEYEATAGTNNNPVYAYTTHELPETLTATEINNLVIYLDTHNDGGGDDRWVDHIRMGIYKAGDSNTNYTIDREYQWTSAVNDKTNESVCIYVDFHTGSENLYVDYWTGSAWSNLGTISSTGWTNLTAIGLSSSTYTIRINGTSEATDTTQDDWDINVISLHTWNYSIVSGTNWAVWTDGTNPDILSPWSWSFYFPNNIGYYEFYSIGKRSGYSDETAPGSADAICKYEE